MKHRLSLLVLLASLAPRIGLAVLIGEPAPPLVVKQWIKGQPVEIKAGTNIFVVEIWGTTSEASRASITNLNDLQKRFKNNGVVIVGISDEPVEKIKTFVQRDGTNIAYAIGADDQRKTALGYMRPVKQQGIPYAFVVGTNGTVLWHGHPLGGGLGKALSLIMSGQYDVELIAKSELAAHQMEQYLGLASRGDSRAKRAGKALLATRTNEVVLLLDMAYQIAATPQLEMDKRDFGLADEALDQAEKLSVTNKASAMITRAVWLFQTGKLDAGMSLATQALASAQSPQAKTNIQLFLGTMEARLAAARTNQSNTNQGKAVRPADAVPTTNTVQTNSNRGQDSPGKH